ncbi:dsDNA nuclease domain-containing protein [Priestia aryabhattai]|uniref:dsDNA nuclease domain-containing protein n=1 Tax=Priestia aryabhattai TaxID=412384 RepID=UPI001CCEA61D|nr:dsDNA nuclease domain-containing protein [Priestia aryabhattai]MBZ6489534.1 DUF4297 domain-containing protein [Priestia aryabhattai]
MSSRLEKTLSIQEEVKEIKQNKSEYNKEQQYILENEILVNDSEHIERKSREIYNELLSSPTREDGGRNALFGFYYQFLVAVDYLIDVAEGKWDFMAYEIHDDIVLCKDNAEEKIVRFVQVKTSKNYSLLHTSTGLSSRSKKTFGEGDTKQELRINDSWLDKLFINAELFKDRSEIKQEFQLVTNFTFYVPTPSRKEAQTKNINHYRSNTSFGEILINDDDPFYNNLRENVVDLKGEDYIYEDKTGMSIKQLLSRTNISERVDHLNSYQDGIAKRLGDMISRKMKTTGGATVLDEDINWLIGEMCSNCAQREDKLVLFVDQKKANELVYKLLQHSKKYSEAFNEIVGNKKFIDEAFERFALGINKEHPEAIKDLEEIMLSAKKMINNWIQNDGDILQIVSRFITGREELIDFHTKMHKNDREDTIFTLAVIFTLLKVVNEETRISLKYKTVLIKEVKDFLGKEYDVSLLKMDNHYTYDEMLDKLEDIIIKLHMESHEDLLAIMLNQPHRIIVDGLYDGFEERSFNKNSLEIISLSNSSKEDVLETKGPSMSIVNYKFLMIPWHVMNIQYARFKKRKEGFSEFQQRFTELWNKINEAGE